VDYRKRRTDHTTILIDGAVVEQVESFKFLGVHINNKLEWFKHTKTVVKRARQSLFPLRKPPKIGIQTGCITAWYDKCSASDRKALQRAVRTAQYITGAKLPAIQNLYTRQCQKNCQTPATLVIDCSLYYRMASGTGVPGLGQKVFSTVFTPKP
jgi:hypothetical protein